jgi:hypothetical protein
MSKWLVDLADERSVTAQAQRLELAFNLDVNDPNYMPVTRDLSPGKRDTLLAYLAKVQGKAFVRAPRAPRAPVAPGAPVPVLDRRSAAALEAMVNNSQTIKGGT